MLWRSSVGVPEESLLCEYRGTSVVSVGLLFGCCGASGLWVQGNVCCCLGREEACCVDAEEDLPSGPVGVSAV